MEKATFGAGCFWGVQASFDKIKGVSSTTVGYMGGKLDNPSYEDVCSNKTGHIEVVQIDFDPTVVSYEELLDVFWKIHDPTSLNCQGPDVGIQYKSVVFYHTSEQKKKAAESKNKVEKSGRFSKKIVTEIIPAVRFWKAEDYHQKYFEKHGMSSCPI